MFLGIDQSFTSAGYCSIDLNGNVIEFGTVKTKKDQGDIFYRSHIISQTFIHMIDRIEPYNIGLEGLAFGGVGSATRDLAGLQHVIITRLRYSTEYGDNLLIVPPTDLKKFATTKGKASKDEMFDAMPQQFRDEIALKNFKKTTGKYDIADAYWIAQYLLFNYNKTKNKI